MTKDELRKSPLTITEEERIAATFLAGQIVGLALRLPAAVFEAAAARGS